MSSTLSSPSPQGIAYRLLIVFFAVVVGVAACDSGGSGMDDDDDEADVAQTFSVTVEEIDGSYPYSGQNNVGVAYAIDGEVGAEITLERGSTYEFVLQSSVENGPAGLTHPFYVDQTAEGQGAGSVRRRHRERECDIGNGAVHPPVQRPRFTIL